MKQRFQTCQSWQRWSLESCTLVWYLKRERERNQCLQVMSNPLNIHHLLTRVGTSVKSKLLLGGHPVSSMQYVTRDTGSKTVSNHCKKNFC